MGRTRIYENSNQRFSEWTKENCDTLLLKMPKGEKAIIKAYADINHQSATRFILNAIESQISQIDKGISKEEKKKIHALICRFREEQEERDLARKEKQKNASPNPVSEKNPSTAE